jgi:hypothetical protein
MNVSTLTDTEAWSSLLAIAATNPSTTTTSPVGHESGTLPSATKLCAGRVVQLSHEASGAAELNTGTATAIHNEKTVFLNMVQTKKNSASNGLKSSFNCLHKRYKCGAHSVWNYSMCHESVVAQR